MTIYLDLYNNNEDRIGQLTVKSINEIKIFNGVIRIVFNDFNNDIQILRIKEMIEEESVLESYKLILI